MLNEKREPGDDVIFQPLSQAWECAAEYGLRRLSDDDLLRLLSAVDAHLQDSGDAADACFAEAPDWDDKSPAELEAIAYQYEHQLSDGTSSGAIPVRAPLRRRHRVDPARLSFEELESRFSPGTVTLLGQGGVAYVSACSARWLIADERPMPSSWNPAPATVQVHGDVVDHALVDFHADMPDPVALGHLALAQAH
jgi:hypothetical protein